MINNVLMTTIHNIYGNGAPNQPNPARLDWNRWLENAYKMSVERASQRHIDYITSMGFTPTINDDVEYCFQVIQDRQQQKIAIRIMATMRQDGTLNDFTAFTIGKLIWSGGGDIQWGIISQ
jgi:hypothetical protein